MDVSFVHTVTLAKRETTHNCYSLAGFHGFELLFNIINEGLVFSPARR